MQIFQCISEYELLELKKTLNYALRYCNFEVLFSFFIIGRGF